MGAAKTVLSALREKRSERAEELRRDGEDERDGYELCCFLTHTQSSSECAVWRKRSQRLLVVAFRGTSDVLDVLTDVNLIQTPYEQGFNGQEKQASVFRLTCPRKGHHLADRFFPLKLSQK